MSEDQFAQHRRDFFKSSAGALLATALLPRVALSASVDSPGMETAEPKTSEDRFRYIMKSKGAIAVAELRWWMCGEFYLCRPGEEPLQPLVRIESVIVQNWTPVPGGVLLTAREIGYYADMQSGQPLDSWKNPRTGEMLTPSLFDNGPSETMFTTASALGAGDLHRMWERHGDEIVLEEENIAGLSHATLHVSSYYSSLSEIRDEDKAFASADVTVQTVFSEFPEWMQMNSPAGFLYARLYGTKTPPDIAVDPQKMSRLNRLFPGVL